MVCDIVTENFIKGIIVAHSKTGITVNQIANVFEGYTGECWPFLSRAELDANQYLQQIDGILSFTNEKREKLWYVRGKTLNRENSGKIYRSNGQTIATSAFGSSKPSTWQQPHGSIPDTCIPAKNAGTRRNNNHNNNNNNNNDFRNVGMSKHSSGVRNNNGCIHYSASNVNGNHAPQNTMQQKFYKNNGHGSGWSGAHVACNIPGSSGPKTGAALCDFDLVGDDFFMELAKIDLRSMVSNRKRIHRSGFCVSGQSIRDATDRIKRYPEQQNMKIIANLGSVDILHGHELADICQDYVRFMDACQRRCIQIVITTLAPLANRLHSPADTKKLNQFNEFLVKQFSSKVPVIDITSCMVDPTKGKCIFGCYQPEPKYVSGSNQPHMLWNRIGRQRILKKIKQNLPI